MTGANATTVINAACNALTPGRTWEETVIVKGRYVDLGQIVLPSYIILEIHGYWEAQDALNTHLITNSDHAGGNIDITIQYGHVNANKENQTADMSCIYLEKVTRPNVFFMKVRGGMRVATTHGSGIVFWECIWGKIVANHCYEADYDNIKVRGGSTRCLVANNTCRDSGTTAIQVSSDGTEHVDVIGNLIYEGGCGIRVHYANHVLVEGNKIRCYTGIELISDADFCDIQGNHIWTSNTGIKIGSATPILDTIKNNTIKFTVSGGCVGIDLNNGEDIEVDQNTIDGTSSAGDTGIDIAVAMVRTRLGFNSFINVATRLVNASATTEVIDPKFMMGFGINSLTADGRYLPPMGAASDNGVENCRWEIVPMDCFISHLTIKCSSAPGGVTARVAILRKNGANTTLTCTITGAETECEDNVHWVEFARGDHISVLYNETGDPVDSRVFHAMHVLPI